jgi:hypothetical protein
MEPLHTSKGNKLINGQNYEKFGEVREWVVCLGPELTTATRTSYKIFLIALKFCDDSNLLNIVNPYFLLTYVAPLWTVTLPCSSRSADIGQLETATNRNSQ